MGRTERPTVLLRSAPNDRIVRIVEEEADAHHGKVVIDVDGVPAAVALMDLAVQHTHHARNTGTANIDVENADLEALGCKAECQLRRNRTLADSSLSRKDHDRVLYGRHSLLDQLSGYKSQTRRTHYRDRAFETLPTSTSLGWGTPRIRRPFQPARTEVPHNLHREVKSANELEFAFGTAVELI